MKLLIVVCYLFLSACTPENSPVALASQTIPVEEGQSILIKLNEGEVTIFGSAPTNVKVQGQTLFPSQTELHVTSAKDQIQIMANYTGGRSSEAPIRLKIYLPDNVPLKIETDFASIAVQDYGGELQAASVSGDILVKNVNGQIMVRSNRGNVNIQDSKGKISIAGNYGLLSTVNARGDIGMSTIMGKITFNGFIGTADAVRLETDHAPIGVNLNPESSVDLQVRSTSGDVSCLLPNLSTSLRGCNGKLNSGDGTLNIRTVSGAVTVQLTP